MGKIDETLLYNGFNSYEFSDGDETLWNETFNVALYSHISVQLVTIKLGGTATGKFIVRWIDEDKKKIGNDNEISFDVTNRWSRKTATLEVPENADTATIAINGAYFHIACPMAEAGEIATAFDPSLASKMAWHDATGSYVGFLSADQIVAGILRSVTGDSGFDLELPRIWMKSNDGEVTWEATPENPLTVKDKDGKLISGIVQIDEKHGLVSQFLAEDENLTNGYGKVGRGTAGYYGYEFNRGEKSLLLALTYTGDVALFTGNTQRLALQSGNAAPFFVADKDGVVRFAIEKDGGAAFYDNNGKSRFVIYESGATAIFDNNGKSRFVIYESGDTAIFDNNGKSRFVIYESGATTISDNNGKFRFVTYESGATTIYGNNNNPRIETYANGEMAIRNNSGELRIGVESNGNSPYLYNGTCTIAIDNTGAYIGSAYGKRIEVHNNGITYIKDDSGSLRLTINPNGNTTIYDNSENARIGVWDNGQRPFLRYGNHELGVDATGPYYIKSGTKTYF